MNEVRSGLARWGAWALAIAGSMLGLGLLASMLLPPLASVGAAEVIEDPQTAEIGAVAKIEPAEGWSVQPIAGEGLLLQSPDRVLRVTMLPAPSDAHLAGQALVETLADGAQLSHVTSGDRIDGLLDLEGADVDVRIEAQVEDPARLDDYRAELAQLLLRVSATR